MTRPIAERRRLLAVFSDDPKVRSDVAEKSNSAALSAFRNRLEAAGKLPDHAEGPVD